PVHLDEGVAIQGFEGERVIQPAQRDKQVGADRGEAGQRRGQLGGGRRPPPPGWPGVGRLGRVPWTTQDARTGEGHTRYYMASRIWTGGNSSYKLRINRNLTNS